MSGEGGRGAGAGRPGRGGEAARGEGPLSRAPAPAPLARGERVEGGSGAGRGGKLSRRGELGRVVGRPGSWRSGVAAPLGGGWGLDSGRGVRAEK